MLIVQIDYEQNVKNTSNGRPSNQEDILNAARGLAHIAARSTQKI